MNTLLTAPLLPSSSAIAGIDPCDLELLRQQRPSLYGQPSECCGSPETCAAACGDLKEVTHGW